MAHFSIKFYISERGGGATPPWLVKGVLGREDSIILSAHDKDGNRIETVEFSLTENKVIQSRGVCNTNTDLHDRIVNLVNANAHRFIKARVSA